MEEGKSFEISRRQALEAYKRVKANHGGGGIDGRLAEIMNPVIRGWSNYFSRYNASEARKALDCVNLTLAGWIKIQEQSRKKKLCQGFQNSGHYSEKKPESVLSLANGDMPDDEITRAV
jgi:hypothetical protein